MARPAEVQKKIIFLLSLAVWFPAVLWSQTDTTELPEGIKAGIQQIFRMAEQAQRFYDDSLAPRVEGAVYPIPEYPTWELFTPTGQVAPPRLTAKIAGSRAGSIALELPAAVCYRMHPGSEDYLLDSLPPLAWTAPGEGSASYSDAGRGPLRLDCRVDCAGPMINYRFDLENTGADTLFDLQVLVPLALGKLPALLHSASRSPRSGRR